MPVPVSPTHQTPDYELDLGPQRLIAEVKEIELNEEEERESQRLLAERGYTNVISRTPGARVRKKISEANPQLKARSRGILPTLLVLYDSGRIFDHIDAYNIRVGMYGFEQLTMLVPPLGSGQSPRSAGLSYGPSRKMTETCNTSISAVAALQIPRPDELDLHVFHNKFARVPVQPSSLSSFCITQFRLEADAAGTTAQWIEVK